MEEEVKVTPPAKSSEGWVWWLIVTITYIVFGLLYGGGAAKLAYGRTQSLLIAILAFFLSPLYYTYYAFTQPSPTVMGAARKLKGWY